MGEEGPPVCCQKFDYYYSEDELAEWVTKIRVMQENASELHPVMNTNYEDQGIANARLMERLLG